MKSIMAKVKTSELIGPALDWVVAVVVENSRKFPIWLEGKPASYADYSANWVKRGAIIEREISEIYVHNALECWAAKNREGDLRYGPTPLIAVMRCFIVSKLGDEVEVPDDLL